MSSYIDMSTDSVQFLVQCDRDGIGFANASDLLNMTTYTFDLLCQTTTYQFRVLAYRGGVFSKPSPPTYLFLNGVTGTHFMAVRLCMVRASPRKRMVVGLSTTRGSYFFFENNCFG